MVKVANSFIFPVHNEAEILVNQVAAFLKMVLPNIDNGFEIILVENGSTDLSKVLVEQLATKYSYIRAVTLSDPSYGNAIKQGILKAKGEKIFVLNVDYFDGFFIKKAMGLLEYVDIVIGSKTLSKSQDQRAYFRRLSTYFFNVFLRLVLNYPGTDTHGIKAFRRSALLFESIERCRTKNELFDTELVLRMTHNGAIFVDLPQQVVEIRPTRYLGLRRVRSTFSDLILALKSKYFSNETKVTVPTEADDYGISKRVNQAIREKVASGEVTVVAVMANLVDRKSVTELRKSSPKVIVSMHFNLLRGKPVSAASHVKSMINDDGYFYSLPVFFLKLLTGQINLDEVKHEFIQQYKRLRLLGLSPKLVNSEQHLHVFPPISNVVERTSTKLDMESIRSIGSTKSYLVKKPFRFVVFCLLRLLASLKFGSFEEFRSYYHAKIVHPGTNYD